MFQALLEAGRSRRRALASPQGRSDLLGRGRWHADTRDSSQDRWLTAADARREFASLDIQLSGPHGGIRLNHRMCVEKDHDVPSAGGIYLTKGREKPRNRE